MKLHILLSGGAAAALLVPAATLAQDGSASDTAANAEAAPQEEDYHTAERAEIIVTVPYRRAQLDTLSGTSVLTGQELTHALRPTIGETLAREPGVSATSFGPNASRPVLRGLQGERVRVLTDGIGSFDVSNTSVDHAVAINPLNAERIEVLRGPSALLFGSSAIGGVVNVIDNRIPRRVPDEPVHIEALATYGSAADERSASGAIDIPAGDKFVLHFDGSYTRTDDLDIGGHVLSREQRRQARASGDPEIAALADLKGTLPNSAAESWEVAGGAALITDGGNLGFSVSHIDNLYGVPVRYSLDPAVEAEEVRIDMRQTRADFRAEVQTGGGLLDQIRFRAGWADYRHDELEDTGEIGTSFFNKSLEGRLELVQAERGGWTGASGIQYFARDFDVVGEEKFLPENSTRQFGIFTLQSVDFGPWRAEAGLRFEHAKLEARADADLGNPKMARSFDAVSGSIGASYAIADAVRLGLNLSHSERAPAAEELFPNGLHAGTQSFEVGDPALGKEKSNGIEASLKGTGEGYSFALSAYYNDFDDYIYEQRTGAIEDDLPVFHFRQADAEFYGMEAEASIRVAQLGSTSVSLDGLADYVRAKIKNVGPAPRIPPLRLLGGVQAEADSYLARVEVEYAGEQDKVAAFETPTDAYTMVNASIAWRPFGADNQTSLTLWGNNLFDVDARRHASFLKDFAPLAGRDIRLTARVSF